MKRGMKFNFEGFHVQSDSGQKAVGRGTHDQLSQRGNRRNEDFLSRNRLQNRSQAFFCCTVFPTSSHMFRNLIPALADRYHVVAPDLPGFGFSNAPDRTRFFGWCDCVQYARIESHPGALGKSAFDGGFPAVVLGCVLHFFIAFVAAAVYALASPWIPALRKHFVTFGLLDLVAVYLIMIMWCCRWQLSVPVPSSQAFF